MREETVDNLPSTAKEPPKLVEKDDPNEHTKSEAGLTDKQLEALKQVSSLVAMFQQEALNEKQTRLLAQLKALEKDRLAEDAWKIISALKKEKCDLQTQVEKLKAHNDKLFRGKVRLGSCNRSQVTKSGDQGQLSEVSLSENLNKGNSSIKDELAEILNKSTNKSAVCDKEERASEGQTKKVINSKLVTSPNKKEIGGARETRVENPSNKETSSPKSSTSQQEFRDPIAGVCGLENLGNTCYVNAGLQCLFSVQPFYRFFLGGGDEAVARNNPKKFQHLLSKRLGELICKVWSGSYLHCDPSELYKALTVRFNQLTPNRQHDCHEFLALFLDALHQELNCASSNPAAAAIKTDDARDWWRLYTGRNESLIVDTFQGQLQSKITCSSCDHKSFKYQSFTFLSVPIFSESYHTFVVIWVSRDTSNEGKLQAVRYKVQVTKPSTALKLKTNFLSSFTEDQRPHLTDIKVAVVRNGQIISIVSDDKQLRPFTDRRSKLYIFNPSRAPASMYVEDENMTSNRRTSLQCSLANDSTIYYSPQGENSTLGFMSALDDLQGDSAGQSPTSKQRHSKLTSPSTSTPKNRARKPHTPLKNVYRVSAACSICLEEKVHKELIAHDKCGRLFCRQCLQEAAGGVIEHQISCPRCAKEEAVVSSHGTQDAQRMIIVPILLRRFEEDSKTKRLFGHPNLVLLPRNILGKDVYSFIADLLPASVRGTVKDVASLPFTLHLVDQQGLHCSRCTRITGCAGCQVNSNVVLNLKSCDNLTVQLTNVSRWQAERMSRCIEHESVWRPRNTEDPLQLQDCLTKFVEREDLSDTWFCQKCREERSATKCLSICRLPDTLIIHLKRYSQNGVKITAPVEFPVEELDMRKYTHEENSTSDQAAGEAGVYDLTGCVCHQGSYCSGHYTAYTKKNTSWYRYDDSQVTEESPSNVCSAQAYLLFYHRRAVSSLRTPASHGQQVVDGRIQVSSEGVENPSNGSSKLATTASQTNKKKTLTELRETLTRRLSTIQYTREEGIPVNVIDKLTGNQSKRSEKKKREKIPSKRKAKAQSKSQESDAVCEDGKINTCSCRHCEYLKVLEKQIREVKQSGEGENAVSECSSPRNLDEAGKYPQSGKNPDEKQDSHNTSTSLSNKSSLTSVSRSATNLSVSPTVTESCTTVASEGQATATESQEQEPLQQNGQDHKERSGGDNSILDDEETLTRKLQSAVQDENIRRAVTLLKRKADPNRLVDGLSALHLAVGLESPLNFHFTRLLLDYGGDPDVRSADGLTPIHVAAMWGRVSCLRLLIDRGGNPYQKDNEGMNALKLAKAFEADTSANTSDFLAKLNDRVSLQLNGEVSLSSASLQSQSSTSDDGQWSTLAQSPRVGCGPRRSRHRKKGSVRSAARKISGNLRKASAQFRRGLHRIRSMLSSSSSREGN